MNTPLTQTTLETARRKIPVRSTTSNEDLLLMIEKMNANTDIVIDILKSLKDRVSKLETTHVKKAPKKQRASNDGLFILMEAKGLKQKTLAKLLGCSHQRISEFKMKKPNASKWKNGELKRAWNWALTTKGNK